MSNMMISMVPINGPSSNMVHSCQPHEAVKRRHGQFGLGCAQMHRVRESARVRCQFDAKGRECPNLQLCSTLEHWHTTNTSRLPWAYLLVDRSEAWIDGGGGNEGGEGFGMGCSAWAVLVLRPWQRGSSVEGFRAGRAARGSGDFSVFKQVSLSPDTLWGCQDDVWGFEGWGLQWAQAGAGAFCQGLRQGRVEPFLQRAISAAGQHHNSLPAPPAVAASASVVVAAAQQQ